MNTTIQDIQTALDATASAAQATYWQLIENLAGATSDEQRDKALHALAEVAARQAISAEQIDMDCGELRELQALPDIAALEHDAQTHARSCVEAAAELEAEAIASEACARELRQQADAQRRDGQSRRQQARTARSRGHALRRSLASRGHPASIEHHHARRGGVGGSSCGPAHPNPTTTTIRPW